MPDFRAAFFTDLALGEVAKVSSAVRRTAWLLEPPAILPQTYDCVAKNLDFFDHVLTHQKEFARALGPKGLWYPSSGVWITSENRRLWPKTKSVSIIASDKHWTEGHRLRHEVVRRFGNRIDVFGRGYRPIVDKIEALKDYRYSIAIMNSVTDDYFTEIVMDCFATGTIPIFWGTSNLCEYFNAKGFLSFSSDLDELEIILKQIEEGQYADQDVLKENLERVEKFSVAENWIWENYPFLFMQKQ